MKYGTKQVKEGQIDLINEALTYEWDTVLDIGAGTGWISEIFASHGKKVHTTFLTAENTSSSVVDLGQQDITCMDKIADETYDAVWASHVLEHTLNVGQALSEIRRVLKPNGWLFLMVPPFKPNVVGGHVSVGWNLGILVYVLALAGFNVREGCFIQHGYNVTAFIKKGNLIDVKLDHDTGDIEKLTPFFPDSANIFHGFNGNLEKINWVWTTNPRHKNKPRIFRITKEYIKNIIKK